MYRNNKGRFISKQRHEYLEMRRFKMFLFIVIGGFILGIIGEYHNSHEMPHVVETAQAVETVETVVPDWDPCGLHAVVCENEQPVENAIKAVSDALGREVTDETKKRIKYLHEKATEKGVSFDKLMHVAWCESMFYSQQSQLTYDFTDASLGIYKGQQERSFGIFQLSVPHHNITPEQALDAYFSIDYAIEIVKSTGFRAWYGYAENTDTCASGVAEYWL